MIPGIDDIKKRQGIVYSCYYERSKAGEHFVPEHTLSYQIAGSLILNDGKKEYVSEPDSLRLIRRNQLLKFVKQPPETGAFRSLSIYLNQQILKKFSLEYGVLSLHKQRNNPVLQLKTSPLLKGYIDSVLSYHHANYLNDALVELKLKEGIMLLLETNAELKDILFDFNEPHKIVDLEAFMNKNFHFNVNIERFAYLTGRSLATFKRDFEKVFASTPGRWLLQRRLQEAHFLIKERGKNASDIYLDLGFEDLSHFSFAFKKQFGEAPSRII